MVENAEKPAPILCAHLLREVDAELLELLAALAPDDWSLPTVAPLWQVRDVAAHLLDTVLRKLSLVRDGWSVEKVAVRSAREVADLVNRLNREGVAVFRRLSPRLLIELMRDACAESADFHEALDPFAPAVFSVSWAGELESPNWFDTARELTERWHHQQQIRLATGRPGIMTPRLYFPVLDCFARGLPHAYREVEADAGAVVRLEVDGECGGAWQLERGAPGWALRSGADLPWQARVVIPQELAWRVFTRGIDRAAAQAQSRIEGRAELGLPVFGLTAVVA